MRAERAFEGAVTLAAIAVPAVLVALVALLLVDAAPALQRFGLGFVTDSTWDPVNEQFGALPFIFGTLLSSAIGLIIAVPLSIATAVYLTELAPPSVRKWGPSGAFTSARVLTCRAFRPFPKGRLRRRLLQKLPMRQL